MNRMLGLILVVIVLLSASTPTYAQTMPVGSFGTEGYEYRGDAVGAPAYQTFGGFGFEYGQVPDAGGVMIDRFGKPYGIPVAAPAPAALGPRPRPRQSRVGSNRVGAQSRTQLPTGSLYWPAANGVSPYSPAARYQAYGSGYAQSPYGGIDAGMMWMGWPLSY